MSCHPDARGWLCHPEPENCALRRWRGDDTPLTRRFAAPSPRFAGRGTSRYVLLPACGEKVAGGRMRGVSLEAAKTAKDLEIRESIALRSFAPLRMTPLRLI